MGASIITTVFMYVVSSNGSGIATDVITNENWTLAECQTIAEQMNKGYFAKATCYEIGGE